MAWYFYSRAALYYTVNSHYTDTRVNDKIRYIDNLIGMKLTLKW